MSDDCIIVLGIIAIIVLCFMACTCCDDDYGEE